MAFTTATVARVEQGNKQLQGAFVESWFATLTVDPASIAAGAEDTATFTIPGVALGDMVLGASLGVDLVGLTVTGYVSAANTVKFRIQNESTATVDLASSTLKIVIGRPTI